jgi:hypothetical protein
MWAPSVSDSPRARALSPFLPLPSGPRLSAPFLAHPRSCALSAQRVPPVGTSSRCCDSAPVPLSCGPHLSPPPSSNLQYARSPWPRPRPHKCRPLPTCSVPTKTPSPVRSAISPTRRHLPDRLRLCVASSPSSEDHRRSPCPHVRSAAAVEAPLCLLPR